MTWAIVWRQRAAAGHHGRHPGLRHARRRDSRQATETASSVLGGRRRSDLGGRPHSWKPTTWRMARSRA